MNNNLSREVMLQPASVVNPIESQDGIMDAAEQLAECARAAGYSENVIQGLVGQIEHYSRQLVGRVVQSNNVIDELKAIARDYAEQNRTLALGVHTLERENEAVVDALWAAGEKVAELEAMLLTLEPSVADGLVKDMAGRLGVADEIMLDILNGDKRAIRFLLMTMAEAA
jgi:hypothetical protein